MRPPVFGGSKQHFKTIPRRQGKSGFVAHNPAISSSSFFLSVVSGDRCSYITIPLCDVKLVTACWSDKSVLKSILYLEPVNHP